MNYGQDNIVAGSDAGGESFVRIWSALEVGEPLGITPYQPIEKQA